MAYTNAIYYLDFTVTGGTSGDGARATLSDVVFSNPSADIVLGTKVAHGLVTGAVIDVTGCTQAYANSAWKITWVSADTFTLDGASWAAFNGADVTGDAVPRGGQSWEDAWATITTGASAARIQAGDIIKIAKSPDPVSLEQSALWTGTTTTGGGFPATVAITGTADNGAGLVRITTTAAHGLVTGNVSQILAVTGTIEANGVWLVTRIDDYNFDLVGSAFASAWISGGTTQNITSKAVILTTAVNTTIDNCETAWTANGAGDVTVTLTAATSAAKEGAYCMKLAFDSSPQTGIMQAYYATGELDLSAYQKLSFWFYNSGVVTAGTIRIALCSDVAGATPVDYFDIPAIPVAWYWLPVTLTKSGGGNLGSSIKSIAFYTDSAVTGLASKYFYVDNFIACTTAGLNLQSLISKNSAAQGGAEGFYGIQSIKGRIILLDNDTATKVNAGRGYSGTTESVTTYFREAIKTALTASSTTAVSVINNSGTAGNNIQYQGGYDTSTGEQTGETFLDGLNKCGYGISVVDKFYTTLNYLSVYRYNYGINFSNSSNNTITTLSNANNNSIGVEFANASSNNTITALSNANNNGYLGVEFANNSGSNTIATLSNANNNNTYGVIYSTGSNNTITTLSNVNNNNTYGIYFGTGSNNTITTLSNVNNNNTYGINFSSGSNNIIEILSTTDNGTAAIYTNNSTNYIFSASISEATKVSHGTTVNQAAFVGIAKYGGVADRWYRDHKYGIASDQITGGQDAAWANGGSGLCQYLNPSSTTYYLPEVFYIPCTAATPVQCLFSVKKTSAAATCTLTFSAMGSGITAIDQASVTLTDAWAEYTSASMTPTEDGFIRIELRAKDGSTTGDIGIDDIHSV